MAGAFEPPRELGNYRVHELLGKGGMASVFRGEHTLLERPVAIKFLRREIATSAEAQQRFLREARLVAKLSHPNIVTVFDFGVLDDGTYYQASELVPGKTLREVLRTGALEPRRALGFARQLVLGLASAHELGIVHRDLKPSNIMVVPDKAEPDGFRLKILDFGIAKSLDADASDSVTQVGIQIGTPGYMAPEQCLGKSEIGPATDIYSLGVVMFVMLCGRRPFDSEDTQQLIDAHLHETALPPSRFSACSPDIDALVLRCLAKSARARPQAMSEVLEVLDRELARAPREAAPPAGGGADREHATPRLPGDGPRLMRLGFETVEPQATSTTTTADAPTATPTVPENRPASRRRLALIGSGGAIVIIAILVAVWPRGSSPPPPAPDPQPQPQPSPAPAPAPAPKPAHPRPHHPHAKAGSADPRKTELDGAVY